MTDDFPIRHKVGDEVPLTFSGRADIKSIEEVKNRPGLLRLFKINLTNGMHFFELEETGERHAASKTRD
jgi:hypothetical protein